MRKTLAIALIIIGGAFMYGTAKAQMTPPEAAVLLSKSVAKLTKGTSSDVICTATKVAIGRFLTARHCISSTDTTIKIRSGDTVAAVTSIYFPTTDKDIPGKDKAQDDWAILFTDKEIPELDSLSISCGEDLYLGQPVAYMGFGVPLNLGFFSGYISSLDFPTNKSPRSTFDYMISTLVSPGSSGSAVISLDTGSIIGVVSEFVPAERVGVIGAGIQKVSALSCSGFGVSPGV